MLTVVASQRARFFVRMALGLALGCVLTLPWLWLWPALAGLAIYGWFCVRLTQRTVTVEVRAGGWTVQQGAQPARSLRWLPGTLITPQLVILQGRDRANGRFVALPIWPDSVPPDQHRRLRVLLRWGCRPDGASRLS
ncbi:protein YgfX [Amantichitinum ursilacus]|uniref:Toxin CptA n=1 Tax=Amantichitinum ursilacus TaxID=857265 RepID=A0A0N1JTP9_9NEIS|nr:protein YgfX [Amantichitinum ursilacus]KPC54738.1 hypothetical protein WG78_04175 [Amantichitinum ursilacus]